MIAGYFSSRHPGRQDDSPTRVPLVDAFVYLPAINEHLWVTFLVDTGADVTVLHPFDATRLVRTPDQWRAIRAHPVHRLGGAGGGLEYFGVPALVLFPLEDGGLHGVNIVLWVADSRSQMEHESLLGRDILAAFRMSYVQDEALTLTPK